MATITKLNGDSGADTIWSDIDEAAHNLARFAEMVSNGKLVMMECGHIRAHCNEIRDLNAKHRRGYNPDHDDNIMVFVDRCGKILYSDEFAPSVSQWFLRDMRLCVSRMRDLVAQRLMSYYRQSQQAQPEHARQRQEANRAT